MRELFAQKNKDEIKPIFDSRAGVLNFGEKIDTNIGVADSLKIGKISWPWQTVPKSLVDACPDEPWAGHYSGSLYELILMLEIFDRNPSSVKTPVPLSLEKKKTYAAIAASFLVATGMHSAVELTYVIKNYLDASDKPGKIDEKPKVCNGASLYIADLINSVSNMAAPNISTNTPTTTANNNTTANNTKTTTPSPSATNDKNAQKTPTAANKIKN